jgi:hypothetical protein
LAREAEVTATTGRAKGSKPRAKKKTISAKAKKPVSAKAKRAAAANPNLVEDVVDVDIIDVVDDVDPLTDLVEKSETNQGAPFVPEVLAAISELKRRDRSAFETLRAQLKRVGVRVTALDEALSEEIGAGPGAKAHTQADIILRLAQGLELFHSADMTAYADLDINGHRETWPVKSKGFARWLARAFYQETWGAAGSEAIQAALNVIEAKAHHDAVEREAYVRIARLGGKLYIDLCDKMWRAIEIDADGWRVVDAPPVRFKRASGATELPVPVSGGSIEDLRPFFNLRNDHDFILVVAWTLAAFLDTGPYPALAFTGEQGVAKSTSSRVLRKVIDPNSAPLRALPRSDRELFISAGNSHLLVFDNVSGLQPWLSDTLCRLSSGGGFAVRSLFTNSDEVLFNASRPIILNGIGDIITRPDLAARALFTGLEPISDAARKAEDDFFADLDAKLPQILGVLLDALAVGLRRRPSISLPEMPRMADFAKWATACETAFWPSGTFMAAYNDNLLEVVDTVIEADLVGSTVRQFAEEEAPWTGTASTLLDRLRVVANESMTRSRDWPNSPDALSNRLRRAATFLRKVGVEIAFDRVGKHRTREITITTFLAPEIGGEKASEVSVVSAPHISLGTPADTLPDGEDPEVSAIYDQASAAPSGGHLDAKTASPSVRPSVRLNPLKDKAADAADTSDASPPPYLGRGKIRV